MRRWHVWAAAASVALVLFLAGWLVLAPGWAVAVAGDAVAAQLGRRLEVAGGAHLQVSPSLAVRLDGVKLAGAADDADALVTAASMTIPVSLGQLLGRSLDVSNVALEGASIGFLIDDRGKANWQFAPPTAGNSVRIRLGGSNLRYFDARNGQAFSMSDASLAIDIAANGEMAVRGTAAVKGRLARLEAVIRSLARVHGDGSPFDLNLSAPDLSFVFNGRLATARVLSLSGTASVSGPSLHGALRWAGIATGREGGSDGFSLGGAFDSAGRAFAMKQADLAYGPHAAHGGLSLDTRSETPKFEAVLAIDRLDLDAFLPESGATPGEWGRNPLGLGAIRSADAAISIAAKTTALRRRETGPAQVSVTVAGGRLDSRLSFPAIAGGIAEVQASIDATATPPDLSLSVRAERADVAQLLPLAGLDWLSGRGDVSVSLQAAGNTQQELVGTLRGEASTNLTAGAIAGTDIAATLSEASQRIVEGWAPTEQARTKADTLFARFTLADGIASLAEFTLRNSTLTMTAKGDVDLLRRSLDLRADPRLFTGTEGQTAGLPVAVVVSGPWQHPVIHPDMKDIRSNPAAAFEALKTMGLSEGAAVAPGN